MNRTLKGTARTPILVARQRRRGRLTAYEYVGGTILALCAAGGSAGAGHAMQAAEETPRPTKSATVAPAPSPTQDASGASTGEARSESNIVVEAEDSGAKSNEPRVLSTEPLIDRPRVTIDRSKRPAWVETPPVRVGEIHTTTVSSGPFATQRGALDRLDEELQAAVRGYIDEQLDSPMAGEKIRYTVKEIKARFVKEPVYLEYGEFEGLGTMQDAHAQLVFDASLRAELQERWRQVRALGRLWILVCVAGAVLATVGVARMVTRRGVASSDKSPGSLNYTAGATILTLVVAGVVLAKKYGAF